MSFDFDAMITVLFQAVDFLAGYVFTWTGLFFALLFFLTIPRMLVFLTGRLAQQTRKPRLLARAFADSPQPDAKGLTVLVAGVRDPKGLIRRTAVVARDALADNDLLIIRLDGALLSNARANDVAGQIENLIATQNARRVASEGTDYPKITLIGHSIAAMLVRKAVLFASQGFGIDRSGFEGSVAQVDAPWRKRLDRVILLAGINGGWSRKTNIWVGMGAAALNYMGVGQFLLDLERGEPFVENLRSEWLDLLRTPNGQYAPQVVQLLGSNDWAVPEDNEFDLSASVEGRSNPGFIFQTMEASSHVSVLDMINTSNQELRLQARRAAQFTDALALPWDDLIANGFSRIIKENSEAIATQSKVKAVVMTYLGLRDTQAWTESPDLALTKLFGTRTDVLISREDPPFVPRFSFLFDIFGRRESSVRWLSEKMVRLKAEYPDAKISIIAHSQGSYAAGVVAQRYGALSFENVVLAGSLLPHSFPWGPIIKSGAAKRVVNLRARADIVSGILASAFQFMPGYVPLLGRLRLFQIGDSGFSGFSWVNNDMGEIASLDGGHDCFVESRKAIRFATAFAVQGSPIKTAEATARALFAEISADTHPQDVIEASQAIDSDFKGGRPALVAWANQFSWVGGVGIVFVLAGFFTILAASIYYIFPFTTFFAGVLALALLYLIFDSL
jgi:pimeloyl-ACP methyl ester carboxylesterase